MHDSFQMISDVDNLMNEKIDIYNKLMNFFKKFSVNLAGILLDSSKFCQINLKG